MIVIESRKGSAAKQEPKLLKKYPGATIIDVTTNSPINEFAQLDPCYPIGRVPIPYSPDVTSESVMGVMLGLMVVEKKALKYRSFRERKIIRLKRAQNSCFPSKNKETKEIDPAKFQIKGFKRGVYGKSMLGMVEARHLMYIPTYIWMLENRARKQINKIKHLSQKGTVILLDNTTNEDINDVSKPLSHAYIIKAYIEDAIPQYQGRENSFLLPTIVDDNPEHPLKDAKVGDLVSVSGKKGEVIGIDGLAFTVKFRDVEIKFSINDTDIKVIEEEEISNSTWNSSEWSKLFEEGNAEKNPTNARAKVFVGSTDSTVEIVNKREYVTEKGKNVRLKLSNIAKNCTFYDSELPKISPDERYDTTVSVETADLLSFTKAQRKKDSTNDLCIINFVNNSRPGGSVEKGNSTNEAYLCRCSDYYRFLFQYAKSIPAGEDYWVQPHPEKHYPLNTRYGGIYSKGVTVFRMDEKRGYSLLSKPWKINIVSVPPPIVNPIINNSFKEKFFGKEKSYFYPKNNTDGIEATKYFKMLADNEKDIVRTALSIAYINNQRRLVFGPMRKRIREMINQVLNEPEFNGAFREVFYIFRITRAQKRTIEIAYVTDLIDDKYRKSTDDIFCSDESINRKYPKNSWSTHRLLMLYSDKLNLKMLHFLKENEQKQIGFTDIIRGINFKDDKNWKTLLTLEEEGLVYKKEDPVGNQHKYIITELGKSFLDAIRPLEEWTEGEEKLIKEYCNKWVLSVLFYLETTTIDLMSYGNILMNTACPTSTLARKLSIMVSDGIILKAKTESGREAYILTNRGKSLLGVLHPLEQWIEDNNHSIKSSRLDFYEKQELKKERKQQIKWQKNRKMKTASKGAKKR